MDIKYYEIKASSLADRAIDGLFGGLLAGAAMGIVIVLGGLLVGESPLSILDKFNTGQSPSPIAGGLMHLAVSCVYGVIFSLLAWSVPMRTRAWIPAWLGGLVYGTFLMGIALSLIFPGLHSPLAHLPLWILGVGHAVYGILLGQWAFPKAGRYSEKTV